MTLEESIQHYGFPMGAEVAKAIADGIRADLEDQLEYLRDDHDRNLVGALLGVEL